MALEAARWDFMASVSYRKQTHPFPLVQESESIQRTFFPVPLERAFRNWIVGFLDALRMHVLISGVGRLYWLWHLNREAMRLKLGMHLLG